MTERTLYSVGLSVFVCSIDVNFSLVNNKKLKEDFLIHNAPWICGHAFTFELLHPHPHPLHFAHTRHFTVTHNDAFPLAITASQIMPEINKDHPLMEYKLIN